MPPSHLQIGGYFGRIVGSPPGLPGGGITGVLPAIGRRRAHLGIDAGGRAQHAVGLGQFVAQRLGALAGRGALRRDVAACGAGCVGAQSAARAGAGGAVCAGGVAGVGGACAAAHRRPRSAHMRKQRLFDLHAEKTAGRRADVPRLNCRSVQDLR